MTSPSFPEYRARWYHSVIRPVKYPWKLNLYDDSTGLLYETSVTATTSWQRVSATGVIPTGDPLLMIITTSTPGTLNLWGGQIEATPYATPYIPTPTNASVTRSLGISNISPPLGTSNALQTYNGVGAITSAINANGHLLPSQSAVSIPVAGSFAGNNSTTGFGLVASIGITGNDLAGILTFTTGGTTSSISANTALFTITLGAAYASTQFVAFCTNQTAATPLEIVGQYYCIPGGSGANFVVYSTAAITPGTSVTYSFQFMTMGAGASS